MQKGDRLGGLGSVVSSRPGQGKAPAANAFQHFLSVIEDFGWKETAILLLTMVIDKWKKVRWAFRKGGGVDPVNPWFDVLVATDPTQLSRGHS